MYDKQKVIDIALAEVGYLEKASNGNLDDKTANAGSNNYTKYARDLDNISGFYNGPKQGFPWCDCFVDWCFAKAYGVASAKKLLCQPDHSAGAGCTYSAQYYKAKGQFHKTPQIGDQIFFGNATESTHTGLVYKVDDKKVYTVEGNTSGASGVVANGGGVCKKSYSLSYGKIYGYGRPAYGATVAENATAQTTKGEAAEKGGECEVKLPVLSKGDEGNTVRAAQNLLIANKCSCGVYGADGDFGDKTHDAVLKFQNKKGLEEDGVIGKNTWSAMLK